MLVVAPTIGVAVLLLVVTVITGIMWFVDLAILDGLQAACGQECSPTAGIGARLPYEIPVLVAGISTIVAIIVGYRLSRPLAWVPAVGIILVVAGYVVARSVVYSVG